MSSIARGSTTEHPVRAWTWQDPHGNDNPILALKEPWWLWSGSPFKAITADETIADMDYYEVYLCTTAGTGRTLTLPTAADNKGRVVYAKKVDSGAGTFTVDGEGAEVIDNGTTVVLDGEGQYWCGICDGSGWETLYVYGEDLSYTSDSDTAAGGVVTDTWYNPGSHTLALTPGTWDVHYKCSLNAYTSGATSVEGWTTLSTANNSESDADFTCYERLAGEGVTFTGVGRKRLVVTSNTTYYLNVKGKPNSGNNDTLTTRGASSRSLVRARRIG